MLAKTKLPYPVGYSKQITLPWEEVLGASYGVEVVDGNVISRYSIKPTTDYQSQLPLRGVWLVDGATIEWTDEGFLVARTATDYNEISEQSYNYVQVIQLANGVLILTELDVMWLPKGECWVDQIECAHFVKAIYHNGRCFGITGVDCKLHFSSLEDAICFDVSKGGGWINFDERGGKCVALAQIEGALYVFRQHSVEKITVVADQRDFAVKSIAFACGKLYGNTVAGDGHKATFLTDWGLWSFDGKSFARVAKHLDKCICPNNDYAVAVCSNHGYVLHCNVRLDGGKVLCENSTFVNNALIVFCNGKAVVLRGWDFTHLFVSTNGNLLMSSNGQIYTLDDAETDTPRQCRVQTNFNSHKGKTVQLVTFTTCHPLTLTVHCNNTSKSYLVEASDLPQSVFVNATGKNFTFVFASNGQMNLGEITIDYVVYKGGIAP